MTEEGVDLRDTVEQLSRSVDDLERLSERQRNFIALAAHELRAPATVLHGITSTLVARDAELHEEQLRRLHRLLNEQCDRLVRLTDQLLDLSRLDADAAQGSHRRVDVRRRIEELVRSVAGERAEEVVLDVEPGLEAVVDPDAFDRIVGNLVANALRHGDAPVSVRAERAESDVRVTVEDGGGGVPADLRDRLFERFSRERPAGSESAGAGLGLAIAQQYALSQGGSIRYEQGEPRGARFRVVLPVPPLQG